VSTPHRVAAPGPPVPLGFSKSHPAEWALEVTGAEPWHGADLRKRVAGAPHPESGVKNFVSPKQMSPEMSAGHGPVLSPPLCLLFF
jgi:hypothetical protein